MSPDVRSVGTSEIDTLNTASQESRPFVIRMSVANVL